MRRIWFLNSAAAAINTSIALATGMVLAAHSVPAAIAGAVDMRPTHEAPTLAKYQSKWKGSKNTYSKILGGNSEIEPYLMEEFLYEKPFINFKVKFAADTD